MVVSESFTISLWQIIVAVTFFLVVGGAIVSTMNSDEIKAQTLSNSLAYNSILANGQNVKITINPNEEQISVSSQENQVILQINGKNQKHKTFYGEKRKISVEGDNIIIS